MTRAGIETSGDLYAPEFDRDGRELKVWVKGRLVFNSTAR
jgi:hypothetical protein